MKRFAVVATVGMICAGSSSLPGGASAQTAAPPSSVEGGASTGSLSSKLNQSDGVITPKADIDPGIHAAAPDPHPNSTPVVVRQTSAMYSPKASS